jgi:excinuclease ABC subunit B
VTLPQVRAMFNGDRARKQVLVDHGFRLPAALDNRPLRFEEFESIVPQVLFVSATPGPYELERVGGDVAEQVIRPTGLLDPVIHVKPARGQVPDLLERCKERSSRGERVLVTALTKRLCEDLATYLDDQGLRVRYLHSEIETLERVEILSDLRRGEFDVLVGVNLLREGLDLPEVSLVCILDADKQGFLRSTSSLIQTMGRAARNANATAVLYADKVTPEMQAAIDEVNRRRARQLAYNAEHGITPETVRKSIRRGIEQELAANRVVREARGRVTENAFDRDELVAELERQMLEAAERLEFERAAGFRDRLERVRGLPESAGLADFTGDHESIKPQRKAGMPGTRGRRSKGGR